MASVATVLVEEKLEVGPTTLTLANIDSTVFRNRRSNMLESKLEQLEKSIEENGLNTNLEVAWKKDGTRDVGLIAGFRRHECLLRIALKKLFRDVNANKHGEGITRPTVYDKESKGQVPCNFDPANKQHRELLKSQLPKEYKEALESFPVHVKVSDVDTKDEISAALRNLDENNNREPVSVKDLTYTIKEFLDKGVQGTLIAKKLGVNKSKITQIKNIADVVSELRTLLAEPAGMEATELANHQTLLETVLEEMEDRIALVKEEEETAIPFSHMRTLSEKIRKHRDSYRTGPLMDFLCYAVQVDKGGNRLGTPTPDYGVFCEKLEAALKDSEKMTANEKAAAEGVKPTEEAAPVDSGNATVQDLAAQQQATPAAPAAPNTTTIAAGAAAVEAANAAADEEGIEDEGAAPTAEQLAASANVQVGGEVPAASPEGAVAQGQRQAAPVSKYTPVAPSNIEAWAKDAASMAADASVNIFERYAQLSIAAQLYAALGMAQEQEFFSSKLAEFFTAFGEYEEARDKWMQDVAAQFSGQGLKPFPLAKPELTLS